MLAEPPPRIFAEIHPAGEGLGSPAERAGSAETEGDVRGQMRQQQQQQQPVAQAAWATNHLQPAAGNGRRNSVASATSSSAGGSGGGGGRVERLLHASPFVPRSVLTPNNGRRRSLAAEAADAISLSLPPHHDKTQPPPPGPTMSEGYRPTSPRGGRRASSPDTGARTFLLYM